MILRVLILFAALACSALATAAPGPGHLSVRGKEIVDPAGNPILLRGWNWGKWGTAMENDAADNAAQGANVVRLPLRWWGFYKNDKEGVDSRMDSAVATAGINPANLKMLDDNIRAASQAKLWIVLFVDSDCGQNGTQNEKEVKFCDPTGQYKGEHNFWTDPAMKAKFISLWRFIANRYKDTPYMGIFEPLPEPGPPSASPQQVTDFYTELMGAIRSVAPGIPFMVGPIHYRAKEIRTAYNPAWKDVIYTGNLFFHTGGGEQSGVEGVRKRVQDMVALRNERNVPLFVQQVGVKAGEDPDQSKTKAVLKILVDNRIGFAYWQYRGAENPDNYGVIFKRGNTWQPKPAELNAVAGSFKQ